MTTVRLRGAAALVALLALASCGTPAAPPATPAPASTVPASAPGGTEPSRPTGPVSVLRCADVVGTQPEPSAESGVVLGVVALPTGRVLEAYDAGEPGPAGRLFAKWGLLVRAGAELDIAVLPSWANRARIGWGSPAARGVRVRVPGCPPSSGGGQWLAFAGGYWVDEPGCVPLTVYSGGQAVRVDVAVGRACPRPVA